MRRVLVYGAGEHGRRLVEAMQRRLANDLQVLGVFDDRTPVVPQRTQLQKVDGTSDELIRLAQRQHVDEVIIALPKAAHFRIAELINKFCALPASITLYEELGGNSPSLRRRVLLHGRHGRSYQYAKRIVDCVLATIALLISAPLMMAIALTIKLDSPGPALFCQARYGFKGRIFRLYKFRTLRHELSDALGERQAHSGDERVTRVGAWLRRTCLDELPQFFNVLKGDMSLVGPRPHPIGMRTEKMLCTELIPYYFVRYRVKPGITGWAQVHGWRGPTVTAHQLRQRVDHDLFYVEHASGWLDLKILANTAWYVLKGGGEARRVPYPAGIHAQTTAIRVPAGELPAFRPSSPLGAD
jgi:exopolysaccharide biosynthesis polyprenyl glycosylphosphotransferase